MSVSGFSKRRSENSLGSGIISSKFWEFFFFFFNDPYYSVTLLMAIYSMLANCKWLCLWHYMNLLLKRFKWSKLLHCEQFWDYWKYNNCLLDNKTEFIYVYFFLRFLCNRAMMLLVIFGAWVFFFTQCWLGKKLIYSK